MPIWNAAAECMSRTDMEALQLERLQQTVARVWQVPFYKERLSNTGVRPEDIRSLADITQIPFTMKDDLRQNYPYGLLATPMEDIVRIHASSGTTGKPTVVGYTADDLDNWSECMARLISMVGVTRGDIAQVAFGYGLFTGALGLHYALEKVGAAVIPISSGNTEKQLMMMRDLGTTTLICTPSYAMYLAESAEKMGIAGELRLKYGLFGGEGSSLGFRAELEAKMGILASENYGLSEVMGPGVSGNCHLKHGLHICEDHFLCEIIDPETGRILPYGEYGEMVITTITKQGQPLLRYRTRDITRIIPEACACGRTTLRMEPVQGRSDDMLIIRGVNVFPTQIEEVLMRIPEIGNHYEIIVDRSHHLDTLEVRVELTDGALLVRFAELEALQGRIRQQLRSTLSLDAKITLMEPNTLQRFEGKAKRVTDNRKNTAGGSAQ